MTAHLPAVADIETGGQLREYLTGLPDDRRAAEVFALCLRPVVYSRHHWLLYKGEYRVRADLRKALTDLQERDPADWDDDEADYVLALFALDRSAIGLDELGDSVDTGTVRTVIQQRLDAYLAALGPGWNADTPIRGLVELADRTAAARVAVQRSHHVYSIIDGRAWYRTEGLIARDEVDVDTLTDTVEAVLAEEYGVGPGPDTVARLHEATKRCLAEHGESAPLVRSIMSATLKDPVLRADHVTITCPNGDLLDSPEAMTTSEAFFTETQLRDGLDLGQYTERLGHDDPEQVQRTIRARMLKLKRGAIRGLYGEGCLHGMFVEKHGGHMIFRNEDAHYRGHQSIGCSSGGRASFALRYMRAGERRELTSMVGDYRVVRMSHDEDDIFNGRELAHVLRYGEWLRTIVEETYRGGCVVHQVDAEQQVGVSSARTAQT
jgi:hypothetical protein